jgi:hypothetical protein
MKLARLISPGDVAIVGVTAAVPGTSAALSNCLVDRDEVADSPWTSCCVTARRSTATFDATGELTGATGVSGIGVATEVNARTLALSANAGIECGTKLNSHLTTLSGSLRAGTLPM